MLRNLGRAWRFLALFIPAALVAAVLYFFVGAAAPIIQGLPFDLGSGKQLAWLAHDVLFVPVWSRISLRNVASSVSVNAPAAETFASTVLDLLWGPFGIFLILLLVVLWFRANRHNMYGALQRAFGPLFTLGIVPFLVFVLALGILYWYYQTRGIQGFAMDFAPIVVITLGYMFLRSQSGGFIEWLTNVLVTGLRVLAKVVLVVLLVLAYFGSTGRYFTSVQNSSLPGMRLISTLSAELGQMFDPVTLLMALLLVVLYFVGDIAWRKHNASKNPPAPA